MKIFFIFFGAYDPENWLSSWKKCCLFQHLISDIDLRFNGGHGNFPPYFLNNSCILDWYLSRIKIVIFIVFSSAFWMWRHTLNNAKDARLRDFTETRVCENGRLRSVKRIDRVVSAQVSGAGGGSSNPGRRNRFLRILNPCWTTGSTPHALKILPEKKEIIYNWFEYN